MHLRGTARRSTLAGPFLHTFVVALAWRLFLTVTQCSVLDSRPWSSEEDELIVRLVKEHGLRKWAIVAAQLKGRSGNWALKGGNSQTGRLVTLFDGPRPDGYEIMYKQGAIVLGVGGDGSDYSAGTFYEGAMTANYTSNPTDEAVQANIVATYGGVAVTKSSGRR